MKPFLSVVIQTRNNARTLPLVLIAAERYLKHRQKSFEIIVADRGSRDATPEIVRRFEILMPEIRPLALDPKTSSGEAVRSGLAAARGNWHAILSAENTAHLDEFEKAIPHLQNGFDLAVGREYGLQLSRKLYRILHNLLVSPEERKVCFVSSGAVAKLLPSAGALGADWLPEMLKLSRQQGLKIKKFPVCYTGL